MFRTVAICGVGLIGGSFGLALRRAGFPGDILGVSSPSSIRDAISTGAIDEGVPLDRALAEADLLYLAQPISVILDCLPSLDGAKPTALITDAGSTKTQIVEQARRPQRKAQFLGGHPMAGKEQRGVLAAEASLFEGRNYFLTPEIPGELETESAQEFQYWIRAISARLHIIPPPQHDHIVAFTSHLAQLASTALAATIAESLGETASIGAGPGLLDMTRLAASSYELWADILATNSKEINTSLGEYIAHLTQIRDSLGEVVENQFLVAANFSKSLRNR